MASERKAPQQETAPRPADGETGTLFRPQARGAPRRQLWGRLLVTAPPATGVFVCLIVALLGAGGSLLAFGELARTERVTGYLVPDTGVVNLQAPQGGLVVELAVREGDRVEAGAPLVRIRDPRGVDAHTDASGSLLDNINAQLGAAREARRLALAQMDAEHETEQRARGGLARRLEVLQAGIRQAADRLELADRAVERHTLLAPLGLVPAAQGDVLRARALEVHAETHRLRDGQLQLEARIEELRARMDSFPRRRALRGEALDREIARLERERIESGVRVEFWLRAPRAGRIAATSVLPGELVGSGRSLLTLLDDGARLNAVLFVPSRAAGFVREGQSVRLLYDAFPFTRFGVHPARITSVSRTILRPEEIVGPAQVMEPVYKVQARPGSEFVSAFGDRMPLQAGMRLEADIELERRALWRWLFEPLLAVRGRLR